MSRVEPALTAEEWTKLTRSGTDGGATVSLSLGGLLIAEHSPSQYAAIEVEDRHAVAALALHDQSFGFTWEDVEMLLRMSDNITLIHSASRLRSLADRIAALLPPREP